MTKSAFFKIPDYPIFSSIIHSFIKTTVSPIPIIIARCRFENDRLNLIEWDWNNIGGGNKKYLSLLNVLKSQFKEEDQELSYVLIFRSYIQFLLETIILFLTSNDYFENRYVNGQLFNLEIDIKTFRIGSNYFHFDGGPNGGNIDILGFCYTIAKDLSTTPRKIDKGDITFVVEKQKIQEGTIMNRQTQQSFIKQTITYNTKLMEDQVIFFNNHYYLHSSPTTVELDIISGVQKKGSKTVLIRFSLTRI